MLVSCCTRSVVRWSVAGTTTEAPDETCSSDEFRCGDGTCIPLSQRCDWTEYHCLDGTDELDCRTLHSTLLHSPTLFLTEIFTLCSSLRAFYFLVRVWQRSNLLIILFCIGFMWTAVPTEPPPRECTADEFKCDDGTCIEQRHRCDREYHCPDGTDEFHCGQLHLHINALLTYTCTKCSPFAHNYTTWTTGYSRLTKWIHKMRAVRTIFELDTLPDEKVVK